VRSSTLLNVLSWDNDNRSMPQARNCDAVWARWFCASDNCSLLVSTLLAVHGRWEMPSTFLQISKTTR